MKDSDPAKHKWFHDYISPDLTMLHSISEVIYSRQTQYQSMDIVNTGSFGVCLILDGKIQEDHAHVESSGIPEYHQKIWRYDRG